MNIESISSIFDAHEKVLQKSRTLFPDILAMAEICRKALAEGHKIMICGNGGSAADAQHIAAEFVGRFHNERISLPSIALTTDTSILTAVANDYSYDRVFARQVEGLGRPGDVLWGISTSGGSRNVNEALRTARAMGIVTIGSTGKTGGEMVSLCDRVMVVPDDVTARIQEIHMLAAHIICELIDNLDWNK
ncbi:D-sedoheptulose 7-phosphate isomerase [Dialister sp.]|uniref:D-sedoheptulose 7-phosphate isomerase n=1 Tax=Dialister sp. TaxID=1955814 RepID=UPI003F004DC2